MSIIWWEKTVEYKFVLTVAHDNDSFLAPLDGTHEQAGDALLGLKNKWILIEFKRDESTIQSERAKFDDYDATADALSPADGHHHLIYGEAEGASGLKIQLRAQTYFSGKCFSIESVLETGIDMPAFKKYLDSYTKFKKTSSSGSGSVTMEDFSVVAGINSDGNITQCIRLNEFKRALKLELVKENTQTITPKSVTGWSL